MRVIKLTNHEGMTGIGYNPIRWKEGMVYSTNGKGTLCGPGWIHCYETNEPALAHFLNPIHADFENPQVWEAEAEGLILRDGPLKMGTTVLRMVKRIEAPPPSTEQRVAFAILCALEVYKDEGFGRWAEGWLKGRDRTGAAAGAAWAAARAAARAAAWAAAWAAWAAAWAAAGAARSNLNLSLLAKRAFEGEK